MSAARIAVVGAGVAGLACAQTLRRHGLDVVVFDKSNAPGGRLATRQTDHGSFDHGAQYFTAKDPEFQEEAQQWRERGVVERWDARVVAFTAANVEDKAGIERYVGVPGMRSLCDHLAADLDVRLESMVNRVERDGEGWRVHVSPNPAADQVRFDGVVVTAPSAQALELVRASPTLSAEVAAVQWDPCWAAMLALARPSQIDFDAAFFNDDPILGWAARDSAKPGRATGLPVDERWVLHAKPRWSRQFFEMDADTAAQWLARAFAARMRRPLLRAHLIGHRWRYATPINPLTRRFLWDGEQRLGAAGDWCHGPRVEDAFLSGRALGAAIAG